jgi:hypothetical protein
LRGAYCSKPWHLAKWLVNMNTQIAVLAWVAG